MGDGLLDGQSVSQSTDPYCFNRIDAGLLEAAVSIPKKSSVAEAARGAEEAGTTGAGTATAELDASSDCQSLIFLLSSRLL